jgi:hypothetical protein
MAAVAVVAVGLTATQRYTTPPVAVLIIAACVGCLTWKRYREVVDSTQAGGSAPSRTRKAGLFIASAAVSGAIIVLSDVAFLVGHTGCITLYVRYYRTSDGPHIVDFGWIGTALVVGTALALYIAACLKRTFWTPALPGKPRPWRRLWPVAATVLIGMIMILAGPLREFTEELPHRVSFCRLMATYHGKLAEKAGSPGEAEFNARMKAYYERAAYRPWLPIVPHLAAGKALQ